MSTQANRPLLSLYQKLLGALWNYRLPFTAVFALALGFHVAVSLFLPFQFCWLPAAVLLLGCGVALPLVRSRALGPNWRARQTLPEILAGSFAEWPALHRMLLVSTLIALLFCALPAPLGLVFSCLFSVFGTVFFSRRSGFYLRPKESAPVDGAARPGLVLTATTIYLAVLGVTLALVGLATQWQWRPACVGAAVVSGLYALAVAGSLASGGHGTSSEGGSFLLGPCFLLPLLLSFWRGQPAVLLGASAVLAVGVPLASFYYAFQQRLQAERACRQALQKNSIDSLLNPDAKIAGQKRDDILGSDGYYRIVQPGYVALNHPELLPTGLAGWVRDSAFDTKASTASTQGPWLLFRGMTGIDSALARSPDKWSGVIHAMVGKLIPVGHDESLKKLAEEYDHQTRFDIVRGDSDRRLLKCPWDSPEVLLLPTRWSAKLNIPPGCGLYDLAGLPCFAEEVELQINFNAPLNAALQACRSGAQRPNQLALARKLLRLYPRIFPACYETLLLALSIELPKVALPLTTGEAGPDLAAANVLAQLSKDVNAQVSARLPAAVAELVDCVVSSSFQLNTHILSQEKRRAWVEYESRRRNQWQPQRSLVTSWLTVLKNNFLARESGTNSVEDNRLALAVNHEVQNLSTQLSKVPSELIKKFSSVNINVSPTHDLPTLLTIVNKETRECQTIANEGLKAINLAFREINNAFLTAEGPPATAPAVPIAPVAPALAPRSR